MKNLYPKKNIISGVKQFTLLIGLLFGNLYANAQAPDFAWTKQLSGHNPFVTEYGADIAFDSQGNSYVVGNFDGSVTFGSTTLTSTGKQYPYDFNIKEIQDIFIAKYDPLGNVLWAKQAHGTYESVSSIAVDGTGNIYITGTFIDNLTFGSITLTGTNYLNFVQDIFIAKLDASGNEVWAKNAGGDGSDVFANGIAVDSYGNSYITGTYNNDITFGSTMLSNGGTYIAKYDPLGNVVWGKKEGGDGNMIVVDGTGNSYITGSFKGSITLGNTTFISSGTQDFYLAKYDPSGNLLWANQPGGTGIESKSSIALDGDGNSYITGNFQGSTNFGITTLTSTTSSDIFIAKYNASGNVVWAKKAGESVSNWYRIGVDESGYSYITSLFQGNAKLGNTTLSNSGNYDIFIARYDPSGNIDWAKKAGGTSSDGVYSIAVDGSGNSFITGYFGGSATFGSTTLTGSSSPDAFIAKYNTSGNVVWATNPIAYTVNVSVGDVVVDAAGNSYLTGNFQGSATLGSITLTNGGSRYNIFIAKYNASGNVIWARKAGGAGDERANSIALDGSGNTYITGSFRGSATFGSTTLTSSGYQDFFIAKYDASGNLLWVKQAGGTLACTGASIAVDGGGNCLVTGYYTGNATFGNKKLTTTAGWAYYNNIFIAKYNPSGRLLWVKQAGGNSDDFGRGIAVDGGGNSYITGSFHMRATFGSTTLTASGTYDYDIFVAKYDASGNMLWAKKAAGNGYDDATGIAVDGSGISYITGSFGGSSTFGSTTLTSNGSSDVFIAKYNASGNVIWAKQAGGTSLDIANSVAIDGNGNSYITGSSQGSATFGSTILLNNSGTSDGFIAKFNSSGNPLWAKKTGGPGEDNVGNIAVDGSGNSYITGSFQGGVTLGSSTFTTIGSEAFFAKLNADNNSARYEPTTSGSGSNGNVLQVYDVNTYPNPFTNRLMLEISSATSETAKVTLTTLDGKTVYQKEVKLKIGRVSEELDGLSGLPAGMYFLRLQLDEKPILMKVMKQ